MDSRGEVHSDDTSLESNNAIVSQLVQKDEVPWYNKPNLRLLYLLMVPTCLTVKVTDGYDSSMVNGLQAVPSWIEYYHHPRSFSLGLMSSVFPLGCVAAVPFAPFIIDKLGRRYSILLGSIFSIVGSIAQGSATNFIMFVVARFILGMSIVFCIVAGSCLVGELSYPKERAVIGSLFNTTRQIGSITAAGITLWTFSMNSNWGWRIPSFLQAMPALIQVTFIWFMPESPRWLISKGRREEALAILVKYHAEGDESSEFVRAEYAQIEEMFEAGRKIAHMDMNKVFSPSGMQKRVFIAIFLGLCGQWTGSGLISHYLAPILDSIGIHDNLTKNIINFVRAFWKLIIVMIEALIVPRFPRRTMYLACATSIFVILVAFTVASADYSYTQSRLSAQVVMALVFLHGLAYGLAFGSLDYTFLTELFPFHTRASGIALFQWWVHCGGFSSQLMNPIGLDIAGWRWYIIYCMWSAFTIVFIYWLLPETSNRTLEELTFLFDEDREAIRESEIALLREQGGTSSDPSWNPATGGSPVEGAGAT